MTKSSTEATFRNRRPDLGRSNRFLLRIKGSPESTRWFATAPTPRSTGSGSRIDAFGADRLPNCSRLRSRVDRIRGSRIDGSGNYAKVTRVRAPELLPNSAHQIYAQIRPRVGGACVRGRVVVRGRVWKLSFPFFVFPAI